MPAGGAAGSSKGSRDGGREWPAYISTDGSSGRSAWLEQRRLPDGTLPEAALTTGERARLIGAALKELEDKVAVPERAPAFIEETASTYVVTFPIFYTRPMPAASYFAQVTIDKASGRVTGVLGGS